MKRSVSPRSSSKKEALIRIPDQRPHTKCSLKGKKDNVIAPKCTFFYSIKPEKQAVEIVPRVPGVNDVAGLVCGRDMVTNGFLISTFFNLLGHGFEPVFFASLGYQPMAKYFRT